MAHLLMAHYSPLLIQMTYSEQDRKRRSARRSIAWRENRLNGFAPKSLYPVFGKAGRAGLFIFADWAQI
jgi:hypothetical protein